MRAPGSRLAIVGGLLLGAAGCGIMWAAGAVPLPIQPPIPPGTVIMSLGALFVGLAPWRRAPVVGALLGLLFAVGFLVNPIARATVIGDAGPAAAVGQAIQLLGSLTALSAGVIAMSGSRAGTPNTEEARL